MSAVRGPLPPPGDGRRWVATRRGRRIHVAAPGASLADCGREAWAAAFRPLPGDVRLACASRHPSLAGAIAPARDGAQAE